MKKFLFLYKGYLTPTPEIGKAWMDWFTSVGDAMVDSGNAMSAGVEVTQAAVTSLELGLDSFTGYSIINAEDMDSAIALAKTNPMITSVVVHDLARM
jgi:hypothetical protein